MDGDVFSCQRCVTSIQTERSCLLHRSWEKDLGERSAIYHYWELEVMVCKSMHLTLCILGFPRLVSAGCEEMVFDPNQSMHEAEIRDRIRPSYLIGFVFQKVLYIYIQYYHIFVRVFICLNVFVAASSMIVCVWLSAPKPLHFVPHPVRTKEVSSFMKASTTQSHMQENGFALLTQCTQMSGKHKTCAIYLQVSILQWYRQTTILRPQ